MKRWLGLETEGLLPGRKERIERMTKDSIFVVTIDLFVKLVDLCQFADAGHPFPQ